MSMAFPFFTAPSRRETIAASDRTVVGSASRLAVIAAGALLGLAALAQTSTPAQAAEPKAGAPFSVTVDRAKVVRIAKPADTIIIGNPAIVDVTIQDARTLVMTGRSYGVTNLIILDTDGDPIVDETVVVKSHEEHTVRIYRRAARQTMACSPVCEPTVAVGDDPNFFSAAQTQTAARNGTGN